MEIVAFLTLAVAGLIVNKRRAAHGPVHSDYEVAAGDVSEDLYAPKQFERARRIEHQAATNAYNSSLYPEASGVIPRNFADTRRKSGEPVSQLSGLPTDFAHANMTPFFGGHVRQTLNPTANNDIIEMYTGMTPQGCQPPAAKIERAPLFATQPIGNVFGAPPIDLDAALERLPVQRFKDNDLPFQQVMVGPAIGGGFTSTPSDGYLSGRQYQIPRDTDELRTLDNPKLTYAGRTIPGSQPIEARGELGSVDEPRYPQRYRETFSADDWMKTTGQVMGEASRPEQLLKDSLRPDMHVPYKGPAAPTSASACSYTGPGEQSASHRSESQRLQIGPASAPSLSSRGDHGRANILVYTNERDTTNVPVFSGSSSTVVKSIVAPLLDMMRPARRQVLGTFAPRALGNVGMMMPDKQTVRDQDGTLRTTIRETTQQFCAKPGALGTLTGPTLLTVYDPDDVAKTTLKEQTIHDGPGPFAPAPGEWRTGARDPDDRSRTTTRQTLDCTNTSINPQVPSRGLLLRDPDLHLRTTTREMNVSAANAETDGTSVGGAQLGKGGYHSADMTAFPTTTREFIEDDDHLGAAGTSVMSIGDGYRVVNATPRTTQREDLSDNSYYGNARQGDAQMSQEEYGNSTVRTVKEALSVKSHRDFGPSGSKEAIGKDDVDPGVLRKVSLSTGIDDRDPDHAVIIPATVDMSTMGLPEVGRDNTRGLQQHSDEGTRGSRGTYGQEMAQPKTRFDEDIVSLVEARSKNPTANVSFYGSRT